MLYTYENKQYTIPDNAIDALMEQDEELSLAEACELYLYDKELIGNEEADHLSAEASKNRVTQTVHGAQKDKRERKKPTRKENPTKQKIISLLFEALKEAFPDNETIAIENKEKYINFVLDEESYTLNLVKHNKKK